MFHQQLMKEFFRSFFLGGMGKFEVSSQGMWAKSLIYVKNINLHVGLYSVGKWFI